MAARPAAARRSSGAIAVGSHVRVVWPSTLDGLTGTVVAIDGTHGRLAVRIDGERWRNRAPIPVARGEVELVETPGD